MTTPDRRTWREASPALRSLLDTPRTTEPVPCNGSGTDQCYAPEQVTARQAGRATYATTTCPLCDRDFTVRIVRTRGGVSTGPTGIVVVPWHRTAREG